MAWPPRPVEYDGPPLFLFDGVCNVCTASVQYILRHDDQDRFRFVPIQSEAGHVFAKRFGISIEKPETAAVILDGKAYFKSDLPITLLRALGKWRITQLGLVLPRPIRNPLYDLVAQNRYRIFGRTDECMVPSEDIMSRFITDPSKLNLNS